MKATTKHKIKQTSIIIAAFVAGAIFAYGFVWWQVYRKFDTVWTCQVFTGALSIEKQAYCDKYNADRENGVKPRYY